MREARIKKRRVDRYYNPGFGAKKQATRRRKNKLQRLARKIRRQRG